MLFTQPRTLFESLDTQIVKKKNPLLFCHSLKCLLTSGSGLLPESESNAECLNEERERKLPKKCRPNTIWCGIWCMQFGARFSTKWVHKIPWKTYSGQHPAVLTTRIETCSSQFCFTFIPVCSFWPVQRFICTYICGYLLVLSLHLKIQSTPYYFTTRYSYDRRSTLDTVRWFAALLQCHFDFDFVVFFSRIHRRLLFRRNPEISTARHCQTPLTHWWFTI